MEAARFAVALVFAVFVGGAFVATATGCSSSGGGGPPAKTAPSVTGAQAKQLVSQGAILVDVRTPDEFADGHIDGARNVPIGELKSAMASLPKDKPIVVYCAVGARARTAAAMLAAAGYDVHNLGAMASWPR